LSHSPSSGYGVAFYYLGKNEIQAFLESKSYLSKNTAEEAFEVYLDKAKHFGASGRRTIVKHAMLEFKNQEDKLIDLFRNHNTVLDTAIMNNLLSLISGGINNTDVRSILKKSKKLKTILLSKEDM